MLSRLARLAELSGPELRLLLQGFVLLHLTAFGLRLFRCCSWWGVLAEDRAGDSLGKDSNPERLRQAQRTAALVEKAARYALVPVRCLEQSLVLRRLLRQQRLPARLRLGWRKVDGKVEGHAWIEHGGWPLGQAGAVRRDFAALEWAGACSP
jgi:hypothetical protein